MNTATMVAANCQECPHCNGHITTYWRGYSYCINCHLILKSPMPSQAELTALYNSSWEAPKLNQNETGAMSHVFAYSYVQKLLQNLGVDNLQNQRILDFGAGRGEMLSVLAEVGADGYGVEPFGHEHISRRGFPVFQSLQEIPKHMRFHGIFAGSVVEHLYQPWDTLAQLYNLLEANGWIFILTPNAASLNARLTRGQWREATKAGHLVLFSPQTLQTLLYKVGFVEVQRMPMYIDYQQGTIKNVFHNFLESVGLEGELKYFARKGLQKVT